MRRSFVFLWYVPVILVLIGGALASFSSSTREAVVSEARSFGEEQEASLSLTEVDSRSYDLTVNLNETYTLKKEGALVTQGDLRAGETLEFPVTLKAPGGKEWSQVRAELVGPQDKPLIAGFAVRVRSCETEWVASPAGFTCEGSTAIEAPGHPLTSDSFLILDEEDVLKNGERKFYLFQIEREPDLILPVKGYETKLYVKIFAVVSNPR